MGRFCIWLKKKKSGTQTSTSSSPGPLSFLFIIQLYHTASHLWLSLPDWERCEWVSVTCCWMLCCTDLLKACSTCDDIYYFKLTLPFCLLAPNPAETAAETATLSVQTISKHEYWNWKMLYWAEGNGLQVLQQHFGATVLWQLHSIWWVTRFYHWKGSIA